MNYASNNFFNELLEETKNSARVVFVSGNFNVLHPGHLRLLKFAADCGDYLVVGVYDNQSEGAILSEELRLEAIRSISWVNKAFILREPPETFIAKLRPSVVVKGQEHENKLNNEQAIVEDYGGKLLFSSGDVRFSSLDLIKKEFLEFHPSTIRKPKDFMERHGFGLGDLRSIIDQFQFLQVVVIGDLIIDEYLSCDALGMSQEDPTIVVSPFDEEKFVGGAGIVAAHARSLGAHVKYFGVVGNDPIADFAQQKFAQFDVKASLFVDESRPTTLKQRYRANGKTLLRVNRFKQHHIQKPLIRKMMNGVRAALDEADLVIFSDFSYGCLPQIFVEEVSAICNERNIMMVADSQTSSQVGDILRFKGMTLLTPTEHEARVALKDSSSGLVVVAEALRKQTRTASLLMTLGSEGLLIHAPCAVKRGWLTDRLPALNAAPRDTAGAGDALLTCASMALASGADIWLAAYLGSLGAACQVGRLGNVPLTGKEIETEIDF